MPDAKETIPVRLVRSRRRGFRLVSPNGLPNVYVGRPTQWGNPFTEGSREFRANKFRENLLQGYLCEDFARARIRSELAGKNLVCWCPEGAACHADVLLAVANGWEIPEYGEIRMMNRNEAALWLNMTLHRLKKCENAGWIRFERDGRGLVATKESVRRLRDFLWRRETMVDFDPVI